MSLSRPDAPPTVDTASLVHGLEPVLAQFFAALAAHSPVAVAPDALADTIPLHVVGALREAGMSSEAVAASMGMTADGFLAGSRARLERWRAEAAAFEAAADPNTPSSARVSVYLGGLFDLVDAAPP